MLTPIGCMGVPAIELRQSSEQPSAVRALATIFAAQLAGWIDCASEVDIAARRRQRLRAE